MNLKRGDILYCIKTISLAFGNILFKNKNRYEIVDIEVGLNDEMVVMVSRGSNNDVDYTFFTLNKDSTDYQFYLNEYFIPNIERRKQILDEFKRI